VTFRIARRQSDIGHRPSGISYRSLAVGRWISVVGRSWSKFDRWFASWRFGYQADGKPN